MLKTVTSERQIERIEAAAFPHVSPESRQQTLDGLLARMGVERRAPRATFAELARLGVPVRTVPKKKVSNVGRRRVAR